MPGSGLALILSSNASCPGLGLDSDLVFLLILVLITSGLRHDFCSENRTSTISLPILNMRPGFYCESLAGCVLPSWGVSKGGGVWRVWGVSLFAGFSGGAQSCCWDGTLKGFCPDFSPERVTLFLFRTRQTRVKQDAASSHCAAR